MRSQLKIIVIGLLLMLTQTASANRIVFEGSKQDVFFWDIVEIRINDSIVNCVSLHNGYTIESLKPETYNLTFISRFNDRQSFTVNLKAKDECIIKIPSYKYYSTEKSNVSFFDKLQENDTLRIFFTHHDCYSGVEYPNYASILKQSDTLKITYTKFDFGTKETSMCTRTLTTDQVNYFKKIESGNLEPKRNGGCTSDPTYYFELNKKIKHHGIKTCKTFIELVENK